MGYLSLFCERSYSLSASSVSRRPAFFASSHRWNLESLAGMTTPPPIHTIAARVRATLPP